MLKSGLYEKVISRALGEKLDASVDKLSQTMPIDKAEASKVLAKYIADIVEKGLDNVVDNGGDLMTQVALANKIVSTIKSETQESEYDGMQWMNVPNSFWRFWISRTASMQSTAKRKSSVRRHLLHRVRSLPVQSTNRRCSQN